MMTSQSLAAILCALAMLVMVGCRIDNQQDRLRDDFDCGQLIGVTVNDARTLIHADGKGLASTTSNSWMQTYRSALLPGKKVVLNGDYVEGEPIVRECSIERKTPDDWFVMIDGG